MSDFEDKRDTVLFTVSGDAIVAARKLILGCENCSEQDAHIPFNWVLDQVLQFSGLHTDYILAEALTCPWCGASINEETLIDCE